MLENIRLSFQGIWAHKMRSFLTMLGIIIGIASIIAIVSTIKGTNEQIKNNLIGSGDNTVKIYLKQGDIDYDFTYQGIPDGVPEITDDVLEEIKDIPEVKNVTAYTSMQPYMADVYHLGNGFSGGNIYGVDNSYFDVVGYKLLSGRKFVDEDFAQYRKVALLDENAVKALFDDGEDPVGKTIEIKGEPYVVIGTVAKTNEFVPVMDSPQDFNTYMGDSSGIVFVNDATWPAIYSYDQPQNVIVTATSTDDMTAAGKKTAEILNSNITKNSGTINYKSEDVLEQAKKMQELSNSTNKLLIWVAGISLLVGGIGVMNIMLVSVTERTREIGLKKAIGARKSKILAQFLTEAAVLTSLGGLLGVLAGIGLAEIVKKISEVPVAIYMPAVIGSVVFSMVVGIVFGLLPSVKAANLDPIEALRQE